MKLIYHSRPRADMDWQCQRMRYYAYDYQGGLVKDNLSLDLFMGSVLHDAIAAIATHQRDSGRVDIDTIATASKRLILDTLHEHHGDVPDASAEARLALEQSTLGEGLIRGFYKQIWPILFSQYPKILAIEQETIFPHDETGCLNHQGPFVFMAKPDLVLEDQEGNIIYYEIKSTGSKKLEWVRSWNTAIQIHATAKAIEFTLKKAVLGTIVQGLYKGSSYYGKFSSPFCYGYARKGNHPFTKTAVSHDYSPGLIRTPIWELEMGMKGWIDLLPTEVLSEQFPRTPLIFIKDDLCKAFFRQRALRESAIVNQNMTDPLLLDMDFPQSFSRCSPSFGHECEFLRICHGPALESPLDHGFLLKNHDHEIPYVELVKRLI